MNKVKCILIFAFGAAVGSVLTWRYIQNKTPMEQETENRDGQDAEATDDENYTSAPYYGGALPKTDGISVMPCKEETEEQMEQKKMLPYIISPDIFGDREDEDYEMITLKYYEGDDVITDEDDNVLEGVTSIIGDDVIQHFGEYEDDTVFIRNDILKCDYEVLRIDESYSDVLDRKPWLRGYNDEGDA